MTGEPAFPQQRDDPSGAYPFKVGMGGMSLRDYFAGQAIKGLTVSFGSDAMPPMEIFDKVENLAGWAYEFADAMLKAREEKTDA